MNAYEILESRVMRKYQARFGGGLMEKRYSKEWWLVSSLPYVDAESGSVESGVYTAQERISAALERDYREKMPFKIIEEVLRTGVFHANGQPVAYHDVVEEALAPLRSATLNLLSEKWQRGTTVDVVYLSGGGAQLVLNDIKTAYPQTVLVQDAQLANARGYLNYARFIARQ
jgi:hypothetical protein